MVRSALILVSLLLSGCVGSALYLEFEHGSSIQDYYDRETTDMVGLTYAAPLRLRAGDCSLYCPEIEVSMFWEVTGNPTYGRDPVGHVRLRQPLLVR